MSYAHDPSNPRPYVWFPHEPSRWDGERRCFVSTINTEPANEFGDVAFALSGLGRPPSDVGKVMPSLREAMSLFRPQDYLAMAGDFELVVWCALLAKDHIYGCPLNLLRWSKQQSRYILRRAEL